MPGSQGEGNATTKRGYGSDTLRPVTIKQLLDAEHPHPDADHILDGQEMKQVTFVGQVRNISTQTTNVTYKLDDGTGTIEVKVWVDAEAVQNDEMDMGAGKRKPVEQGYARVWGRLKDFNNRRHVGATVIRPIEDPNEISYHLLEATVVHLHFTRGPLETQQANGGATNGHSAQQQTTNGYSGGGGDGGDVLKMQGVSQVAKKVFACLKQTPQTNEGLHAQDIASRLNIEITEVQKASDELMGLGKVYTTVDDNTWAILDI